MRHNVRFDGKKLLISLISLLYSLIPIIIRWKFCTTIRGAHTHTIFPNFRLNCHWNEKVYKFIQSCVNEWMKIFGHEISPWWKKFSNGNRYVHRFIIIFVESSSIREVYSNVCCVMVKKGNGRRLSVFEHDRIKHNKQGNQYKVCEDWIDSTFLGGKFPVFRFSATSDDWILLKWVSFVCGVLCVWEYMENWVVQLKLTPHISLAHDINDSIRIKSKIFPIFL